MQVTPRDLPEDIVADVRVVIYGYHFRKIAKILRLKRKTKLEERWFCLPIGPGADLPEYVRFGAHRTGFKSFNNFFAMAAFYSMEGPS